MIPVTPLVAVISGQVVRLGEQDYRCGTRPLRLRVVRVRLDLSVWHGGEWVWLEGVELRPDDAEGGHRMVLVRVAALPGFEVGGDRG